MTRCEPLALIAETVDYHSGTTWASVGRTPVVKSSGSRFSLDNYDLATESLAEAVWRHMSRLMLLAANVPLANGTSGFVAVGHPLQQSVATHGIR